ncbi:hypothetical protein B0T26DRAFT_624484, partial [Lasiosphaeria miniovina]
LVGMTGSGKSTFISRLTGQASEAGVGHSLASATVDTACYTAAIDGRRVVRLVDTPGFDDTSRPAGDILRSIAARLATIQRARQRVAGIIFVHRITDVRLGGAAIKTLHVLQRLCGPAAYGRVLLATTMWADAAFRSGGRAAAEAREDQLRAYWDGGDLFAGRSAGVVRHESDDAESASAVVNALLNSTANARAGGLLSPLQIQRELVENGVPLDETEAGRYVRGEELQAAK